VKLDALAAAKDYYWHARAPVGGTTGPFGPIYKFTVGPRSLQTGRQRDLGHHPEHGMSANERIDRRAVDGLTRKG
jgi:hypothetical protein